MRHEGKKGYVYILTNPSMPGLVKIGHSKHGGEARARHLRTTGVPAPFVLRFEILATNAPALEADVHAAISEYRVDPNREYFAMSPLEAIEAVLDVSMAHARKSIEMCDEDVSDEWVDEPAPKPKEINAEVGKRAIREMMAMLSKTLEDKGHA